MPASDRYAHAPRLPGGDDLDPAKLVESEGAPVELEIGPGRGGFVFERLAAAPEICFIGLEIRRKWATILDQRLAERGLSARARCFAEDARFALPRLRAASLRAVFVSFPDPWWKKRHQKRLVLAPPVPEQIERVLCTGGELFVQTDVPERAEAYAALLSLQRGLEAAGDGIGPELGANPYGARSPRERRALADGLPVFRLRYRRVAARGNPA